jgi:hypothetical protein
MRAKAYIASGAPFNERLQRCQEYAKRTNGNEGEVSLRTVDY